MVGSARFVNQCRWEVNKGEFNVSSINGYSNKQWIRVWFEHSAFCTKFFMWKQWVAYLEKAQIFPCTYDPPQQNTACHLDVSGGPLNRLFLQVHICPIPSSCVFKSTLSRTSTLKTKGIWVFHNVLGAAFEHVRWN